MRLELPFVLRHYISDGGAAFQASSHCHQISGQLLRNLRLSSFSVAMSPDFALQVSKEVTTHPESTPQAIPLANYERNPFIACW